MRWGGVFAVVAVALLAGCGGLFAGGGTVADTSDTSTPTETQSPVTTPTPQTPQDQATDTETSELANNPISAQLLINSGTERKGERVMWADHPLNLSVELSHREGASVGTTLKTSLIPADEVTPAFTSSRSVELNEDGDKSLQGQVSVSDAPRVQTFTVEISGAGIQTETEEIVIAPRGSLPPVGFSDYLVDFNRGRMDETYGPDGQFHYPFSTGFQYDSVRDEFTWQVDTNGLAHETFGGRKEPVIYAAEGLALAMDDSQGAAWLNNGTIEFTGRPAYNETGDYVEGGIPEQTWTAHVPQRYAQAYINSSVSKEQFATAVYGTVWGNYLGAQRDAVNHDSREQRRRFMAERMERELETIELLTLDWTDNTYTINEQLQIKDVQYLPERDAIVVRHRYGGNSQSFIHASTLIGHKYGELVNKYGLEYAPSGGVHDCSYDNRGLYHYMNFTTSPIHYHAMDGSPTDGPWVKPKVIEDGNIRGSAKPLPEDPVCQKAPLDS